MKKNWTWSQMLLAAAAVALLVSGSTLFAAKGGGGKPPKDDPPPEPEPVVLPDVRYRIKIIEQPTNATASSYMSVNGFNNLGQVVGKYFATDGERMFVYDPLRNANQALDMNTVVTAGIPTGWRLRSGLGINDHMVVVGNMEEISTGQVRPVAIDLATVDPVVDLLPVVPADKSHGYRINENGDILGLVELVGSWIFNPCLYGDPAPRAARDAGPLDMSDEILELLLLPLSGSVVGFHLNNPVGSSPAQIAGVDADGVAFRYTLGDENPESPLEPLLESFPEVNLGLDGVAGLNDSGTFCGSHRGPKIKGQISVDPFRFNQSLDLQPKPMDGDSPFVLGLNSSGDLLGESDVFRDDWGWVKIDDLVVGSISDMQDWSNGRAFGANFGSGLNDRGGESYGYAGQITGDFAYDDGRRGLFVLTPEPFPAP